MSPANNKKNSKNSTTQKAKVIEGLKQTYTDASLHIQRDQFSNVETSNCLKFINYTFFNKQQKNIRIALVKNYRTVSLSISFACYSVFAQENNLIVTCSI